MTLDDLNFHTETYQGDSVDFFEINSRYHGYTRDHEMYHVFDENTTAYTSYTGAELNSKLQSGFFGAPGPGNTDITNLWNNSDTDIQTGAGDITKTIFIGAIVFMLVYLITNKS
jgi:hypothetical protein